MNEAAFRALVSGEKRGAGAAPGAAGSEVGSAVRTKSSAFSIPKNGPHSGPYFFGEAERDKVNEAKFRALVSGRKRGAGAALARAGLRVLSFGYRAGVSFRNRLYDRGLKTSHQAGVPVISVGNLTTGGTGKTPIVAFLANWFRERGIRVAILSRGYRSVDGGANDEKLVLDQLCPTVPHLQNPDRVASARQAVEEHHAQLLILDDGFQHRRLGRDSDLVLIDATCPWGYGALLPRGLLREPKTSLHRAGLVILTRADQIPETRRAQILQEIQQIHPQLPSVEAAFVPRRLINALGETCDFETLQGRPVSAFCGIGNPTGFLQTLASCGLGIEESQLRTFPDHHHYTAEDCQALGVWAGELPAAALLTTQKDLVKIPQSHLGEVPVWAVEIGAELGSGAAGLISRLEQFAATIQAADTR